MFKTATVFLSVSLLFCLTAASVLAGNAPSVERREIRVIASFYPMYIMAKNVLKDVPGVIVTDLTPAATGCLHDHALSTDEMKKLADADVFIANGAGMESFLGRVVEQYPQISVLILSEGLSLIKASENGGLNPHVWVSISNAILEVKNLGAGMARIDPRHAELYLKNADEYIEKLDALRRKMHQELELFKGARIITFHEAFPYFAREFGFEIAAVVEREPGSEPGARDLAETVDIIRKEKIHALFSEPQYPALAADTIARETGVKVNLLDPAVSGPDDSDAYLNIMLKDLDVLKMALAGAH